MFIGYFERRFSLRLFRSLRADWQLYTVSETGSYFYDAESIVRQPNNILRVWDKHYYSQSARLKAVREYGKKFEHLDEINRINLNDAKKLPVVNSYRGSFAASKNSSRPVFTDSLALIVKVRFP